MPLPQQKPYTIKDIYALPEGTRAELVDGQQYNHFTTFSTILYIGNEIRIKIRILSVKVSGFPRPASRGESQ